MKTIKELFNSYSNLYQFEEGSPEYLIDEEDFTQAVKEYSKKQVQENTKELIHALEKAVFILENLEKQDGFIFGMDKIFLQDAIKNATK